MSVFHDEVEIEDFEYDEETETYYYPCPCGDQFEITKVLNHIKLSFLLYMQRWIWICTILGLYTEFRMSLGSKLGHCIQIIQLGSRKGRF